MIKTISLELSKRLDKLGLLRDVETKYCYMYNIVGDAIIHKYNNNLGGKKYKTLTTDEAIEFLPKNINCEIKDFGGYKYNYITWNFTTGTSTEDNEKEEVYFFILNTYMRNLDDYIKGPTLNYIQGKTLIESIENLITYLLDNNLIGPTKIN